MKKNNLFFIALIYLIIQSSVFGQETIWLSPQNFVGTEDFLTVEPSFSPNDAIIVKSSFAGAGNPKIILGLNLSSQQEIDSIVVCYQLTNSASYISQVRLTYMTTPDAAFVNLDDPTDLTSTSPTRYSTYVGGFSANATITLNLFLQFADVNDIIEIGAIGVVLKEPLTSINENPVKNKLESFNLNQNYPNPFNPSTTISYSVPASENVTIKIYNNNGELITTLLNGEQSAGNHSILWNGKSDNGSQVASGVYYYQVISGEFAQAKKMILLK